jgi:ABC-2 type transport system permease protein
MKTFAQNASIFYALIARDIKTFKKVLPTLFINGIITVSIAVIVWGKLLPLIGMSPSLIAPIFIGHSLLSLCASVGYSHALRMVYDLKNDRFIDYLMTLPLSHTWLFFYFVASASLETFVVTLPLISVGIIFLGNSFCPVNGSFSAFCCFYITTLIFWSLFFMSAVYSHSYNWFRNNIWARRIMPLFACSSAFYPWADVERVSPIISRLMLINPITYVSEGLRSSLLGGHNYIPWQQCLIALLFFCILLCYRIKLNMYKHLDPA